MIFMFMSYFYQYEMNRTNHFSLARLARRCFSTS